MVSFPSDELAERRARRDGRDGPLAERPPGGGPPGRLTAAEHEIAVLTARLGETVAERDLVAGVAASRREELEAARDRESALRARVRVGEAELSRVRAQLAERTASEASLRVQATGLHARIHALRAQLAGHDARIAELAAVVTELRSTAGAAHADVERHLAARAEAEDELEGARRRAGDLEERLATVRAELDALHAARDRTLGAEEHARAARAAEWAALRARTERLRPAEPAPERSDDGTAVDVAAQLARAAERLRGQTAPAPDAVDQAAPGDAGAAEASQDRVPARAPEPPVAASSAPAPAPPPERRSALRRRLRRLFAGRP